MSDNPPRNLMNDWMIVPAYGPGLQFERIAINQGALCIECRTCGRRSALTSENCPHIRLGQQRHGCESADVRLYNAHTEEEATMWLAGDPLPAGARGASAVPAQCRTHALKAGSANLVEHFHKRRSSEALRII